jgi:DNA-binding NarL/FixJ family response regulator
MSDPQAASGNPGNLDGAGGAIRVVIADDHAVTRSGICRLLENAGGFTVVGEAATGEEALRLVRAEAPDVLVLDLQMPQGSGPEVARRLRDEDTPTRILALSAHESESYVEKLLEAGASGYLTKDQAPERVAEAVRAVAGGAERWFVRPPRQSGPAAKDQDALGALTDRERDVLRLVAEGHPNAQIAGRLCIAEDTVRTHLAGAYRKIGAHSAREAVAWAWRNGLPEDARTRE